MRRNVANKVLLRSSSENSNKTWIAFFALEVVSQRQPGSPLDQLGLELGDVVTWLDGVPLHCYRELDCHAHHTHVRYIKTGTRTVRNASVHIDVQRQGYSREADS